MIKKENQDLSKEKLLAEIERLKRELKKRKKYGLVWEEKLEEVVETCKEKLPVLKEVKNKEIITDKDKPLNLLIEGDNYHALSVLNYTHAKKIDVIYIDPPYNTGNKDFIFNDHYVDKEDSYRHSKWLSFMEKRLKLARNLLKDNGVIFISIDDNEMAQVKLLCNEIFGEQNFVANYIWESRSGKGATAKHVVNQHEYVLCFARDIQKIELKQDIREAMGGNFEDENGRYRREQLRQWGQGDKREDRPTMYYPINGPNGSIIYPVKEDGAEGRWRVSKKTMEKLISSGDVDFVFDGKRYQVYRKIREGRITKTATGTLLLGVGTASTGTLELKQLFKDKVFDTTKPMGLIKYLIDLIAHREITVLDFMAGSGTTGHVVLEMNKEDSGNRKFILCTNNENSIATDICYPRIKIVMEGYKSLKGEKVEGLGGNLKYFKTDFVDAEPTDKNKIKLTEQATEMLCVKEGTFEMVLDQKNFKIFKNFNHYTGIIFDQITIPAFKKAIKAIKGKFSVYVFSLGDETFDDEFKDIKQKVQLSPIPEAILRVYRRIFK
jgi:adenine-specific DNA-methyltransferase